MQITQVFIVDTPNIATGAVETDKIADLNVTRGKLATAVLDEFFLWGMAGGRI